MTLLFQNKYRIQSARHPEWDYTLDNEYFITICTHDREEYFGNIINEKMQLNDIGKIVNEFWQKISQHFDNVILDEYIIMPNHIHGIIIICNDNRVETRHGASQIHTTNQTETRGVNETETRHGASLRKFGPLQKESLSLMINQFKGGVKRWCNQNECTNFAWQTRFHDRIVRNEQELNNIRNYIYNNPYKWETDRNNYENLWM